MTTFLKVVAAINVGSLIILALLLRNDTRWYKRHPGVEKKLAKIDRELDALGL
jgi:hypothetical protein